jgi:hypothetical protein
MIGYRLDGDTGMFCQPQRRSAATDTPQPFGLKVPSQDPWVRASGCVAVFVDQTTEDVDALNAAGIRWHAHRRHPRGIGTWRSMPRCGRPVL